MPLLEHLPQLITVARQPAGSSRETYLSVLSHAEELINAGRLREARRLVTQFVERKEFEDGMLPALAGLYLRIGKPEQAVATMQEALERIGPSSDLANTFGLMLAALGRDAEGRAQFEEALRLDPDNTEALRNLAFTLHRAGERERAWRLLVQCYHVRPLSAELRLVCGALFELDGHRDEAICCYRDVLELVGLGEQMRMAATRLVALGTPAEGLVFEDVMERMSASINSAEGLQL